jgi:hypothetical protein
MKGFFEEKSIWRVSTLSSQFSFPKGKTDFVKIVVKITLKTKNISFLSVVVYRVEKSKVLMEDT